MILIKTYLHNSDLNGIGLFAQEDIKKGQKVWEYTEWFDFSLSKEQVDKLSLSAKDQFLKYAYLSYTSNRYVLCSDDARFFNHSHTPNVRCVVPDDKSHVDSLVCFAERDIMKDEELTCDYNEFEKDSLFVK